MDKMHKKVILISSEETHFKTVGSKMIKLL